MRVNEAGRLVLPVWVAWKPMVVEPPGGMEALWLMFVAVT